MFRHEVEVKLAEVFTRRFSLDFLNNPEMKEMKLLGKSGIPARELLHVFFDVKNIFDISIPEDDVATGRFDTFVHITDIICEQMSVEQ
jgi:acyl carrier protein